MSTTADDLPHDDGFEPGEPLSEAQILNIVAQELQQSSGGNENDFIDQNRQDALSYYLGSANGKEVEGKSTIVSTDVADAIEWILPTIMKSFTENNEVVKFDPIFEGDEDQAALESQYCYDILMKQNAGFVQIHQYVKDCLMQKNGIFKTYYEEEHVTTEEDWTGIGEEGLMTLVAEEGVEIIQQTDIPPEMDEQGQPMGPPTFDVRVSVTKIEKHIRVMAIPPEEFRIARQHNSVDIGTARFSAHILLKSKSDLIKEGYSADLVNNLPHGETHDDDRDYRFYMQNETVYPDRDVSNDSSQDMIEISECYINIDMNNTGISEMYQIIVSGGDNPDRLLGFDKVEESPFNGGPVIMMSHKFFGMSIYDRLRQLQDQKTTLWRNMFDNLYLQNNQRNVVLEGQVNLDDLLVSRPGGIIRVKSLNAVTPLQTPMLGQEAWQMMDYLDQVRAGRAGVSPEGSVQVDNIGDRVGSEGIAKLMTAKEELVGLMIRVIAETAIKPLCYRIRDLAIQHNDVIENYKFRGYWTDTNPSEWIKRTNSTVRVGTGTGNRQEMVGALQMVIDLQGSMADDPQGQLLINPQRIFNAINDFGKAAGLLGVREYFIDPNSPEGKQKAEDKAKADAEAAEKDEQMQMMQMKFQADIAKAETDKAKAQMATAAANAEKNALELKLEHQKQMHNLKLETLKSQLEHYKIILAQTKDEGELRFKYENLVQTTALELTRIESAEDIAEQNENFKENKESVSG